MYILSVLMCGRWHSAEPQGPVTLAFDSCGDWSEQSNSCKLWGPASWLIPVFETRRVCVIILGTAVSSNRYFIVAQPHWELDWGGSQQREVSGWGTEVAGIYLEICRVAFWSDILKGIGKEQGCFPLSPLFLMYRSLSRSCGCKLFWTSAGWHGGVNEAS